MDAGTSLVKVVAFDDEGTELAIARRRTTVLRPRPGHSEQDMAGVWNAVCEAVREVAVGCAEPVEVLAVTGQGDGCWLVDAAGEPTGPAILWNDGRAAGIVEAWRADGVLDAAYAISGNLGFSGLPHAILTWLRRHDPDRVQRSAAALTCTGWIFSRLTGVVGIDPSEASNPFFDIRAADYSPELLDLFGLPWARDLRPPVRGGGDRVAPLTAVGLGLPAGLPVVMAPFDIAAAMLGLGATTQGELGVVLGTTLCTGGFVDEPPDPATPSGMTLAGVLPGRLMRALPSLAGTEVIDWAVRLLRLDGVEELSELVLAAPDGVAVPVFLPYLSPAGERVPFLDSAARGALLGIDLEHGPADIARAVLAGLTLLIRDCAAALGDPPALLRVGGGGARSDVWCQLLADYCGAPVLRTVDREVGAKGALIVARLATGTVADPAAAVEALVTADREFAPRPLGALPSYERFLAAREAVSATWRPVLP